MTKTKNYFLLISFLSGFLFSGILLFGQDNVECIDYDCTFSLAAQKENLSKIADINDDEKESFGIVLFYSNDKVRTQMIKNEGNRFASLIKDMLYTQGIPEVLSIDSSKSIVFRHSRPPAQLAPTGKTKTILGYKCEEYLEEINGRKSTYWITDELGVNISPNGNISILGTVLEYFSTVGFHYIATRVASVQARNDIFSAPKEYREMNPGKSFSQIERERVFWKNKKIPGFTLKSSDNILYSEEELRGKIVVVNFWYTTCQPCIGEMPELNEIVALHKDNKDILFLGIALDDEGKVKSFIEKRPFNYTLIPGAKELIKKMSINSFPVNMIIDKQGIVRFEKIGYDGEPGELLKVLNSEINKILSEK